MFYEVTGNTQVSDYEYVYAGVEYCKEQGIPNMHIGDICEACGQGYIVREVDRRTFKDFVCIHCGKRETIYEDPNGIF